MAVLIPALYIDGHQLEIIDAYERTVDISLPDLIYQRDENRLQTRSIKKTIDESEALPAQLLEHVNKSTEELAGLIR